MQGIYKIVNKVNGKYYVGSSVDSEKRWKGHRSELGRGIHCNVYFQNAWNKYGEESFILIFVEEVLGGREARQFREQDYLDEGFAQDILYNLATNAEGGGNIPTQETRDKMSKSHTGRVITWGDKISKAKTGHEVSDEQRLAQSKSMKKWYKTHVSPSKAKQSKSLTGRKLSDEHRAKIGRSGEDNAFYGKHHTEETIIRLSRASQGNESAAKSYPALYNRQTKVCIPVGNNIAKMCKENDLNYYRFYCLVSGKIKQTSNGWTLAEEA